jgi:hypothetical protein
MRHFRSLLLVVAVLASGSISPLTRAAPLPAIDRMQPGPVLIDFDDLSTTEWGTGGQVVVTDQYASQGVIFNRPKALAYGIGMFGIPGFPHSGTNAIQQCYSEEFCESPIVMTFTAPQRRVKVWVGYHEDLNAAPVVTLSAFDAPTGGSPVASATAVLGPSTEPIPVQTPLEVTSNSANIRRVEVVFPPDGTRMDDLVVDDVEFDAAGGAPPCPAGTNPPTVSLDQPADGLTTQLNAFTLRGTTSTTTELAEATLSATSPGGTHAMPVLTDLIQPAGGSFGSISIGGLLLPGVNTVTVAARNCAGTGQDSATVVYSPIAEGTRFVFMGMEVTQAIQDMDHNVPLIAGKRTFVRVYLRAVGGTSQIQHVSGEIRACSEPIFGDPPSCLLGGSDLVPLRSLNRITVDDSTNLTEKRRDMDDSLNFELPPAWTAEGRLHIEVDGLSLTPDLPCDGCDNLTAGGSPRLYRFQSAPPVLVDLVDVSYTDSGSTVSPTATDFAYLESWLRRAYPTASVVRVSDVLSLDFDDLPTCEEVNDRLLWSWWNKILSDLLGITNTTPPDARTHFYGLVADGGGFMRGCAAGIPSRFAAGPTGSGTFGWDFDGTYADWYGGHELGHTYGRHHPGFCDDQPNDDDSFPFAGGFIASSGLEYFGFDTGDASNGLVSQVYAPDTWTDVMTYCVNQWISSYTYKGILSGLTSAGGSPAGPVATPQPGQDVLLVLGTINLTQGTADLRPFSRLAGTAVTSRPATSPFNIVLEDSAGSALATYPFEPRVYTDKPPGADETAQLGEVVPWVPGTDQIVIRENTREIASRRVSANSPRVQFTSPNGGELLRGQSDTATWQASDADGDALTYSLLYSPDAGTTWLTVAVGIKAPYYTVDLSRLPGSDTALYRVIATDGVNTAQDESDQAFRVPGKGPEVRIIAPTDGASFGTTQTIVLTGEAVDAEHGTLDGDALQWTSDLQGTLGAGRALAVTNLNPGRHTITLTATDQSGGTATADVVLEIVEDDLPTLTFEGDAQPTPAS